jgi:hypothetical protein
MSIPYIHYYHEAVGNLKLAGLMIGHGKNGTLYYIDSAVQG